MRIDTLPAEAFQPVSFRIFGSYIHCQFELSVPYARWETQVRIEGMFFRQIRKFARNFHGAAPIPLAYGCEFRCPRPRSWTEPLSVYQGVKCLPAQSLLCSRFPVGSEMRIN